MANTLQIPPATLRRPGNVVTVLWRQWRTERRLRRRGLHFRDTDPERVAQAYAAMSEAEFEGINARQDWANWRTIPRCLAGNVPDRPLRVIDLGCGTGGSSQVLAYYCPPGSHVTGYELAEPLLAIARRRRYVRSDSQNAHVDFRCQGVTEPWCDAEGRRLPPTSVDVVNASGVVGHHLDEETVRPMIDEQIRVLKADGVAMLDVGPTLRAGALQRVMKAAGFSCVGHFRSWFGDPTGQIVFCLRRARGR